LSKLQANIWEKSSQTDSFSLSEFDDDVLKGLIDKDIDSDNNIKLSL
jgi:hypothetical protein